MKALFWILMDCLGFYLGWKIADWMRNKSK